MRYLGIEPQKPRIAVFDFTGCEGCELQLANKEETLHHFLGLIEVVAFREISSAGGVGSDYDVALIEGCISRQDEVERLQEIRQRAKVLVAMGSCACFGGVSRQKNVWDLDAANRVVYGDSPRPTEKVRSIKEVVPVDMEVSGCPVSKPELERIVQHLIWGIPYAAPGYPVCYECKQRFNVCMMELGQLCLGSVSRGGCGAPCPSGRMPCWGCRGAAADPNLESFLEIAKERGFSRQQVEERLAFFAGFEGVPR